MTLEFLGLRSLPPGTLFSYEYYDGISIYMLIGCYASENNNKSWNLLLLSTSGKLLSRDTHTMVVDKIKILDQGSICIPSQQGTQQ